MLCVNYRFWNIASLMATVPNSGIEPSLDDVVLLVVDSAAAALCTPAELPPAAAVAVGTGLLGLSSIREDLFRRSWTKVKGEGGIIQMKEFVAYFSPLQEQSS